MNRKPRIAHLSGPTATIQNTPPLVTSTKARQKRGLPPLRNTDGSPARFDALRAQRLAAPAKLYVEQFSAHPLEADSSDLYGPPDGYVDAREPFTSSRPAPTTSRSTRSSFVQRMASIPCPIWPFRRTVSHGRTSAPSRMRRIPRPGKAFFPTARVRSRRSTVSRSLDTGQVNAISALADIDFYRPQPPSGYRKGLPAGKRTDIGEGDIPPEVRGKDFFPYRPVHLAGGPPRPALAQLTNVAQKVLSSGKYDGVVVTQGSPSIEETSYWLSLLMDTTLPICGNSAQRPQGMISNDGPKNIVELGRHTSPRGFGPTSKGATRTGVVVIQEQQFFAAREVTKGDARPGGYIATGGHGGIIGGITHSGALKLTYLPAYKHTHLSDVNMSKLPASVKIVRERGRTAWRRSISPSRMQRRPARQRHSVGHDRQGWTLAVARGYGEDPDARTRSHRPDRAQTQHGQACRARYRGPGPLWNAGIAGARQLTARAVFSGLPVARVGRGSPEGFADPHPHFIAGSNLTATKARLLLMACLMKFGSLPAAKNPDKPTSQEMAATKEAVARYQQVFDTH